MSDSHWVISTQEVKFKYIQIKWYDSCTEKNPSLDAIIAEYVYVWVISVCVHISKWLNEARAWHAGEWCMVGGWVGGEADMIYKEIWKCMEICDIIG